MRGFTKFVPHLVPTFLVLWLIFIGGRCFAQEVDVPTGRGSGSVVAPSGWTELIAPVQQRIDLKFYGFYIGEAKAPSAQFDATFKATKFLSITPSYLYYSVAPSGLDELANHSQGFTHTYQEHQFRIDGTVMFSFHKFEISERNMYVRRFFQHTYMAESLFQQKRAIAIAIRSPSRIPSRLRAIPGSLSLPTKPFTTREAGGRKTEPGLASRCPSRSMCRFNRPTCGKAQMELKTSAT